MKTNTRRKFIRNSSLTASGLFLTTITKAKNDSVVLSAIGCAPNQLLTLASTIASVKSGKWSDPATWGGKLPTDADLPVIANGHAIVYDLATTTIAGLTISAGGSLKFEPTKSATLQSSKNIVVQGTLEMVPSNAANQHLIRFINVDETKFVGGGHMVLDTDIGLWVVDSGKLNLMGTQKQAWTNLTGSAAAGSSTISLKEAPAGWSAGDDLIICPTQAITYLGRDEVEALFEKVKINSISGSSVTLDTSLSHPHNKVEPAGSGKLWTAEVLNMKRNVAIEGTATGKSHVFVKSTVPQTIKNVSFRYMGPKTENNGRYALHFHHCFHGSIGSVVENCVAQDQGSHCFVPHTSHGITFKNCIAYNFRLEAYWWDEGHVTHYTKYENCVAALGTVAGFLLGMGDENSCNNCVAVSAAIGRESGEVGSTGAFFWEANNEGVWDFKNNLAHSNSSGIRIWQNTGRNHVLENYCSYNNAMASFHGAYMNSYTYKNGYHYNSMFVGKATSANTSGVRLENITFDAAGNEYALHFSDSPIGSWDDNTNKFYNCIFKNYTAAPIIFASSKPSEPDGTASVSRNIKFYDLIHCDLGGKMPFIHADVENGTRIRIQPKSGQSIQIEKVGTWDLSDGKLVTTNIAPFTAAVWGKGNGLNAEYFNATNNFESGKKVISRIDSTVAFKEWSTVITDSIEMFHHKLTNELYSVKWSGKLLAQYSEEYVFRCNTAGGIRLTVNNNVIIDELDAEPFNITDRFAIMSTPIKLVAGQLYDIKLEHANTGGYRGCVLNWKCPSMIGYEIVPQCQLYASDVIAVPPVVEEKAENAVPVARAGDDKTITLPTNQLVLDGSTSTDTDGSITTYKWTKVSGPTQFTLTDASAAKTTVNNLVAGEYVFRLVVTDDKGAVAQDDTKITVNAETKTNSGPVASAGEDKTIQLPINNVTLDGTKSTDANGTIASYKWTKVSGPSLYTITNATAASTTLSNLQEGTYVFKLQVTDNEGASSSDEVMITVMAAAVENKNPIALAGDDQTIDLPTNQVTLGGFASSDADGRIVSYKWSKINGPSSFTIATATATSTVVSNLVEGEYMFRLEVKDDKGATATDDVKVIVNPKKEEVVLPKAYAGEDQTINLPGNNARLSGNGTKGSTGDIVAYTWTKVSGPSKFKIVSPNVSSTVVNQLVQGIYIFQLEVKDSNGVAAKDEVTITVIGKSDAVEPQSNNKVAEQLTITASPNPSPNVFNIYFDSNSDKPINLKLYDKWGKEVGNIRNVKKGSSVKIPGNLRRGTYFATAEQGFQKKTLTLIKL